MIRYAAYGSNLHPVRLEERIPGVAFVGVGFVPDLSLCFHKRSQDGSGKCNIQDSGRGVHVAVFEFGVDERRALDRIEGVGKGYWRDDIDVPGIGRCFSYRASESHIDDGLHPYDWYLELVLSGCRVHGFPNEYIDAIAMIETRPDPDAERNGRNRLTIQRLGGIRLSLS